MPWDCSRLYLVRVLGGGGCEREDMHVSEEVTFGVISCKDPERIFPDHWSDRHGLPP